MSALICGSLAFDTIMVYPGHFKNEILPDKVHILNVSFLVPQLRHEFGGTSGNIAYNLKLLGGDPWPMGTVGKDFDAYAQWMDKHEICRDYIKVIPEAYTAQAYITTDLDDNQITAFHPGAMNHAHSQAVPAGVTLGTISPDGREGMVQHAQQFAEAGIPFIFDPGQGMPMFSGEALKKFVEQATYVAVNDYELEMLLSRTGWTIKDVASRVQALIVTHGGKGSHIHTPSKVFEIPCAKADSLTDPTGCGDAFRAGLIYGLEHGMDWDVSGRIASLMGAYNIERPGTQNHRFTLEQFRERFKREFRFDFA
ncbi:carbohydrate kinase family protein [Sinimarinibacterium sp. NLF-5-8]|uniref:carbohydrate kinase family protein n=1 Tax=Sinimarinibacterium sp. NLF-5-8 TaxID=2698684 RepID=UPI00137B9BFC|nr:carbohydrate kinase family protein [Sinimarinibacterium sp. NLF-5-8]QHS10000.1 carbohydrate kinase family protein [Sinimarinibacterium sp. NLF-5-8]